MSDIVLGDVLRNISYELARLSAIAAILDGVVGDAITQSGAEVGEQLSNLQDVDLLRQSLDCLSVLVGNLASQSVGPYNVSIKEVGSGVYLGDLRDACFVMHSSVHT